MLGKLMSGMLRFGMFGMLGMLRLGIVGMSTSGMSGSSLRIVSMPELISDLNSRIIMSPAPCSAIPRALERGLAPLARATARLATRARARADLYMLLLFEASSTMDL